MARAEISWEDQPRAWRGALARIEDISRSGACIRVPVPIAAGTRLKIKWQREEFSGVAKYCRRDEGDYILGVQREILESNAKTILSLSYPTTSVSEPAPSSAQESPAPAKEAVVGLQKAIPAPAIAPIPLPPVLVATPPAAAPTPEASNERKSPNKGAPAVNLSSKPLQEAVSDMPKELNAPEPSQRQERTNVFNRLLHRDPGHQQQNGPDGNGENVKAPASNKEAKLAREYPSIAKSKFCSLPPNQGNLLPLQDIYMAVGIMNPKLGYNIDTVLAMLDSGHTQGMTSEVKKASVLMALEAAGMPVNELIQDATKRMEALNAYEENERKRFEEYEARKAQESAQIHSEVERMTAHCLERIKQNLGEVTVAKDAYLNWQTTKQKESNRIAEAVAILTKSFAAEPQAESKQVLQPVGAGSKS